MASTPRIPKAELTGFSWSLVKTFTRRMLGDVPEPAEVMWHYSAVVKDMSALGRTASKWNQLDPDLKSFAHMAVASLIGCTWCLDFGYFHAHNEGLDEAQAREVHRWRESDVFTPLERRVMEFTVAYEVLGSAADAEDVVQEAWLRWADVDQTEVHDPRAYLVRIVTRQALNRLRTPARRREEYVGSGCPSHC